MIQILLKPIVTSVVDLLFVFVFFGGIIIWLEWCLITANKKLREYQKVNDAKAK